MGQAFTSGAYTAVRPLARGHRTRRTAGQQRRPRDRGQPAAGQREAAGARAAASPARAGPRTSAGGSSASRPAPGCSSAASRATARRVQPGQLDVGQRLARPAPQHGAQLGSTWKRHAVVEPPQRPAAGRQQVRALAVGVVDDGVEHRDRGQVRAGRRARRTTGCAVVRLGLEHRQPARLDPPGGHQVDQLVRARQDRRPRIGGPGPRSTAAPSRPSGPSRSTVGGTTSQPPAADTTYAATSRPARVPSGSPTAAARRGSACRCTRVSTPSALDAAPAARGWRRRRAVPRARARRGQQLQQLAASARSTGGRTPVSAGSRWPAGRCGRSGRAGRRRTGRAAGRPRPARVRGGRRPGPCGGRQPTRSEVRPVVASSSSSTSVAVLVELVRGRSPSWHSMMTTRASASQARDMVPTRNSSSIGVSSGSVSSAVDRATAAVGRRRRRKLVEQRRRRGRRGRRPAPSRRTRWSDRRPLAGLEEEGALPGRSPTVPATNRSGGSKSWTRHAFDPIAAPAAATDRRPRRRSAHGVRRRSPASRRAFSAAGGGTSPARSPPMSLSAPRTAGGSV